MLTRRGAIGFVTGALGASLTGCGLGDSGSYRFRMTVEVQTPQGLKSGSSVYEVDAHKTLRLTSEEKGGGGAFRGQATMVNLPGGPLFVLLKTNIAGVGLGEAVTLAFRPDAQTGRVDDYIAAVRALGRTTGVKAELPRKDWPLLVRFGDPRDPSTVVSVDPAVVGVNRIVIETTDAAFQKELRRGFLGWAAIR